MVTGVSGLLGRHRIRGARPGTWLFPLALAAALGVLLGAIGLVVSPLWALIGIIAVGFAVLAIARAEVALLAILVATSTIIYEDRLPLLPIGIGSFHVSDLLLLGLLGIVIIRTLVEPKFKLIHTPLDFPLLAFLGTGLLSTFIAVSQSLVDRQDAFRETRVFAYLLTFFIVTNLVRKREQIVLLVEGLMVLGAVVAGAMVAQSLLGNSVTLFPGRVEQLATQGVDYGDVTRVLPPGQSLVLVSVVALIVLLVLDKLRPLAALRFVELGLVGLATILTFNRNFWVAIGIAVFLLILLAMRHARQRLVIMAVAVSLLGTVVLFPILTDPPPKVQGLLSAFTDRLGTLMSSDTLQESSLQFRYVEYEYAIPQVLAQPLLGLGFGAAYRPWDPRLDWELFDGRAYVHNGHLWIMLRTGLLGYACFGWMSVLYVLRGVRSWRRISDGFMQSVLLAFVLVFVGISVAAIVSPIYARWYWVPVIGIMMGTCETIIKAYP